MADDPSDLEQDFGRNAQAIQGLIEHDIPGAMLTAGVVAASYVDPSGEEMIAVFITDAKLTQRIGLIEYLREWHGVELRDLLED